jgi:hypothetical protein
MRAAKGLNPFAYDQRLESSAQTHAADLAAGRAAPHENLLGRLQASGFPVSNACAISRRSMAANYTEGIVNQPDAVSPDSLQVLVDSGPGEAHYDDFYDPKITRVGVGVGAGGTGYLKNHLVLDYGIVCDENPFPDGLFQSDRGADADGNAGRT